MGITDAGWSGTVAGADPRDETTVARFRVWAVEVRPGAAVFNDRACLQHSHGRTPVFQCLRNSASTLKSLHGRAGDLRFASAERPRAADFRRWIPTTGFCQRL